MCAMIESDLLSPSEVAELLGVSVQTVGRASKRGGLGIRLKSGRLVAVKYGDVRGIRESMRGEVGNPDWIAARGKGPHSRFRKKGA